jgi:hypothetical protein
MAPTSLGKLPCVGTKERISVVVVLIGHQLTQSSVGVADKSLTQAKHLLELPPPSNGVFSG